jgi:hypothetical protein
MSHRASNDIIDTHTDSPQSGTTLRIPDGLTPFVRYASTGEDGSPDQFHRLHLLHQPAPTEADFVSPVYLLTDEEVEKHDSLLSEDDLFRVRGYKSIATKIQTECEDDGRVWYPAFIESDADVPYYEMRAGLKRFIREVLDVDPDDAKWFFSGGSSLHVHLPYYVSDDGRERLRREAQQYNENATVTVDASNFQKKSLVRLPGAEYHSKGVRKAPVSPTSSDKELQARICRLVDNGADKSGGGISRHVGTPEIVRYSLSEELGLIKDIPTPLIEQDERPVDKAKAKRWKRYNRHPFCPYANAGNQRRSVVVAQVKGTPFGRKTTVNDMEKWRTYFPAFVYGAVSCDGEFTIWQENAPVQLSKKDYNKWDYELGDTLVLLGGNNGSSRIIEPEGRWERQLVAAQLKEDIEGIPTGGTDGPVDGRKKALDHLRAFGYEVGSAGKNGPRREDNTTDRGFQPTEAHRLQQRAEEDDVESLSHDERLYVANRLLRIRGWDGADEWFREQYGGRYSQEITHKFLRSVVEKYDDLPSPTQ